MTTTADPAHDYGADVEELELFGPPPVVDDDASTGPDDEPAPAAAPAPPRRRPGPPPNPNSARQRKLAGRRRTGQPAPPPRKVKANTPAPPPNVSEVHRAGGMAVVGWLAKPLAAGGLALQVTAGMARDPKKRAELAFHGQALSLDSLALEMRAEQLAGGMAALAPSVPWAARVLESAARISPFSELLEATVGLILQGLVNHGVMPPMATLGTLAPEELAAAAGVPMEEG